VPLLGISSVGFLTLVRLIATFFTGAISLQMGLENALAFISGDNIGSRLAGWTGWVHPTHND
jgi:hypothetical protein